MKSLCPCLALGLAALSGLRAAEGPPSPPADTRPALDVALGSSVGFDSNLYLADRGPLANRESAVGTLSARVGTKFDSGLALAYSALATKFWEEAREDNLKQTLGASWTRKLDRLSCNAATEFALVDGEDEAVDYGSGVGNAFSTPAPRERRDQWHNKTDLALRHDCDAGFVRAVGKLQYWDMRTTAAGGCNYVDRYDVQGGADLGRALREGGPEAYLGYRRGYQFQDNDFSPSTAINASNHYDRYLIGVEGSPVKSIKVNAQAGWAKHAYNADYAGSANEEGVFTDATFTWTATSADELQFKTSQARTFSTTGKNSVLSTCHQLSWKHVFAPAWSATLGGRVAEAEYAPFRRDDLDYAALASLTWNATRNLGCTLSFSQDWGRDNLDDLRGAAEDKREFDRVFVSAGVVWKL